MTDTIESLRAERDALKAEFEVFIGNMVNLTNASIDLGNGRTKSQITARLDKIVRNARAFIERLESAS